MPLITLEDSCLAFGHHALLNHVDLQLDPGERIGLIGRNGSGKSSLLKVLAKEIKLDDGKLWHKPELKLVYVSQEPEFGTAGTIYHEVSRGLGHLSQVLNEYHEISQALSEGKGSNETNFSRLASLQNFLELNDGWRIQTRVETVIHQLGLSAQDLIGNLSGGTRKRVALARALVVLPDVLLLDEPTNHLDFTSIEWLEELLQTFAGSVIFITHDRRFLDNVSTRIIELDRGLLGSFTGNFAHYLQKKMEMLQSEAIQQHKFDKVLAQEEVWIRKGVQARCTRNEGRVRRLEALRLERAARRTRVGSVNFNVEVGERSGHLVAELQQVTKCFGDKTVIKDFSCRILRGDRIGLLGPNGSGKSTLLKLILGELEPDLGEIKRGTKLSIAYFDQMRGQLNPESTVIEAINQGSDFIEINGERKHVISYLEDFLFAPQRARSPVKSLSGGERNRLLLARLFTQPANLLVLDEPTNDLDIETLELLEVLLQSYTGTLFLVSHDRTFLDNVVTQVIAFEGDGLLNEYVGGYEDWARSKSAKDNLTQSLLQPSKISVPTEEKKSRLSPKLSYHEVRELAALPEKIDSLEREQTLINQQLSDATLYKSNPEQIKVLQTRLTKIEEQLAQFFSRWEELEAKQSAAKM